VAIGPLASEAGAPPVCSLRTIKSDVVVGIPSGVGEKLDEEEPGWKISGKYVSRLGLRHTCWWTKVLTLQAVVLLSPGRPHEKATFL
jgi:hypothetical protein